MTIRTSNVWRQFKCRDEVPSEVLEDQFDWMKECIRGDHWSSMTCQESKLSVAHERRLGACITGWPDDKYTDGFFQYHRRWYHVSEFERTPAGAPIEDWDGYKPDSFFSGVLIKLSSDGEEYKVATYFA